MKKNNTKSANKSPNRQLFIGYCFALIATAIWSGNYIVARDLTENIPPVSLAFWRWMVATIVFIPFALKPLITEWHKLKQHLPYLSLTALLGITTFNTLIYFAGQTTTAVNLSLIAITFPVFIVVLSRFFFHELITLNKSIGTLLVATGIILLITKGILANLLTISFAIGDLWMLMAAIVFALYAITLKRKPQELRILPFQLSTFILGLIFLLPFYIWEYSVGPPVLLEPKVVYSILYVGVFASLTAFLLWNKAILTLGPTKVGMTYYTLPLFSGFLAYFMLDEAITSIHFYSALLIISGIFTANRNQKWFNRKALKPDTLNSKP